MFTETLSITYVHDGVDQITLIFSSISHYQVRSTNLEMDSPNIIQIPIRTCRIHKLEELVVYCKDCLVFICSLCAREDHLDHNCEGVSKFARDVRSQIPSFCRDVSTKSVASMQADLRKLETTLRENDEEYKYEQDQLKTLQEQYIEAVKQEFDRRESKSYQKLYTCNSEIKAHVARLTTKIDALKQRLKTHEDAQAVYSNHDVIEMDKELKDLVAQYNPMEFDPMPHRFAKTDGHECMDLRMEDITTKIEHIDFNQPKSKILQQ